MAAADQAAAKVAAADQAAAKARTAVWVQAVRRIQATVAGRLTRQTWRELMQWMQVKMHGDGNRALREQFLRDTMREQYEFVKQAIERRWRGKKGELDKIASQARRKANTQQDKADRARARDAAVQEQQRQVTGKVKVQETEIGGNRPGQVAQTPDDRERHRERMSEQLRTYALANQDRIVASLTRAMQTAKRKKEETAAEEANRAESKTAWTGEPAWDKRWTTEWGEPWEVGTMEGQRSMERAAERTLLQLVEHDMLQAKWHAMTAEEKKQTLEMYETAAVEKRNLLFLLGGRDPGQ